MALELKKISERTVEGKDSNGTIFLFTQVFKKNGVPITDNDVDGVHYIKFDYFYYKKNDVTEAIIPDPTFSNASFDI